MVGSPLDFSNNRIGRTGKQEWVCGGDAEAT